MAESLSTLSWLSELLELSKGLIIWVVIEGKEDKNTFYVFHNSTREMFLYYKISFVSVVLYEYSILIF